MYGFTPRSANQPASDKQLCYAYDLAERQGLDAEALCSINFRNTSLLDSSSFGGGKRSKLLRWMHRSLGMRGGFAYGERERERERCLCCCCKCCGGGGAATR